MVSVVRSVAKLRNTPSVVETREIKLTLRDIPSIFMHKNFKKGTKR